VMKNSAGLLKGAKSENSHQPGYCSVEIIHNFQEYPESSESRKDL